MSWVGHLLIPNYYFNFKMFPKISRATGKQNQRDIGKKRSRRRRGRGQEEEKKRKEKREGKESIEGKGKERKEKERTCVLN